MDTGCSSGEAGAGDGTACGTGDVHSLCSGTRSLSHLMPAPARARYPDHIVWLSRVLIQSDVRSLLPTLYLKGKVAINEAQIPWNNYFKKDVDCALTGRNYRWLITWQTVLVISGSVCHGDVSRVSGGRPQSGKGHNAKLWETRPPRHL